MFWRARLPEITPLLTLEADPFPKYFVKEGVPSNMPLVSLKKITKHVLANLSQFSGCLKINFRRESKHTGVALTKEITILVPTPTSGKVNLVYWPPGPIPY